MSYRVGEQGEEQLPPTAPSSVLWLPSNSQSLVISVLSSLEQGC